jgi:predicted hydrocarbon binding protein
LSRPSSAVKLADAIGAVNVIRTLKILVCNFKDYKGKNKARVAQEVGREIGRDVGKTVQGVLTESHDFVGGQYLELHTYNSHGNYFYVYMMSISTLL